MVSSTAQLATDIKGKGLPPHQPILEGAYGLAPTKHAGPFVGASGVAVELLVSYAEAMMVEWLSQSRSQRVS